VEEWEGLHEALQEQAQSVAKELQEQKLQATTVKLKLRWSDFSFSTRQTTLLMATDAAPVIEEAAIALLTRLWVGAEPVRLLGVGVSGLSTVRQLGLFDDNPEREAAACEELPTSEVKPQTEAELQAREQRQQRLREALTVLEARFGSDVVHLGARPNGGSPAGMPSRNT
jgi:DNA polymerase-4